LGSSGWASIGWLRYQTFSAADYERFFNQYILPSERNNGWAREDFTKPGLELAAPQARFWQPKVMASFSRRISEESSFLFHLVGNHIALQTMVARRILAGISLRLPPDRAADRIAVVSQTGMPYA